MKKMTRCLFGLAGAGLLLSMGAAAQTVVRATADGQLSVVDYRGKPPYKRRLVGPEDGADWRRYSAQLDSVRVMETQSGKAGPPGKNLPGQVARIERVPASEITRFARFEETGKSANTRLWRGAPGKGRPRLGR